MTKPIKLILIDDDTMFRLGTQGHLNAEKDLHLIVDAESAEDTFKVLKKHAPDIALVDLHLGINTLDGPALIYQLKQKYPKMHCISLTMEDNPFLLLQLIDAGTDGIIRKSGIDLLKQAIRTIHGGGHMIQPEIAYEMIKASQERECLSQLTDNEYHYFQLLGQDKPDEVIAKKLRIPLTTLKGRLASTKRKLQCHSKTELVALYQRFFPEPWGKALTKKVRAAKQIK